MESSAAVKSRVCKLFFVSNVVNMCYSLSGCCLQIHSCERPFSIHFYKSIDKNHGKKKPVHIPPSCAGVCVCECVLVCVCPSAQAYVSRFANDNEWEFGTRVQVELRSKLRYLPSLFWKSTSFTTQNQTKFLVNQRMCKFTWKLRNRLQFFLTVWMASDNHHLVFIDEGF